MSVVDRLTSLIEKTQQQPRYIRTKVMWVLVAVSMVFVFSLWLSDLKNSLQVSSQKSSQENSAVAASVDEIKEATKEVPGLVSSLKEAIGGAWQAFVSEKKPEPTPAESVSDDNKSNSVEIEPVQLPQTE